MVEGAEVSTLVIYETAGEINVDKAFVPSTSRRLLSSSHHRLLEEDNVSSEDDN